MSTPLLVGIIGIIAFMVFIFLGIPVSLSMLIVGIFGSMCLLRQPMSAFSMASDTIYGTFTSYAMSVAPVFMLMGDLATETGIGNDLYTCFQKLIGHRKGGLANATQIVCALFGAICGSQAATAAMMSRVAYPQMKRFGYADTLSTGCISAGSCLAILIPPSMALINYGIIAETSISKLLIGGLSTGVVLMFIFIITIWIWCAIKPDIAPTSEKTTFKEKLVAIRKGGLIEVLIVFGISFAGMFLGWFTPTEAGAVGVLGMLIISIIFKRFTWAALGRALKNTLVMTGMIYCILAGANVFNKFFTLSKIPAALGRLVAALDIPAIAVMAIITIFFLLLGMIMDELPMMLLTTPIFLPIVVALGYDPVWFGCYMVVISGLGAIAPPVGAACFIVSGVCEGVPLTKVYKGSLPFIISYLVMAMLMSIVPEIATWLPSLMR
ncbi:MAG: TRAP transporter large permease [Oscillospiraceae bacterium]|nr:TRAP transporter large permease [Oscillospiraceae bacterium]